MSLGKEKTFACWWNDILKNTLFVPKLKKMQTNTTEMNNNKEMWKKNTVYRKKTRLKWNFINVYYWWLVFLNLNNTFDLYIFAHSR